LRYVFYVIVAAFTVGTAVGYFLREYIKDYIKNAVSTKFFLKFPLIETANGFLWVTVILVYGVSLYAFLACLMASTLLAVGVIDSRIFFIPPLLNAFMLVLGIVRAIVDYERWYVYAAGAGAVSIVLVAVYVISGGKGIGGGDIKLMAVCGLFLGFELIIVAFFIGCILGSVVHLTAMALKKAGRQVAFAPYLSIGVFVTMMVGDLNISRIF